MTATSHGNILSVDEDALPILGTALQQARVATGDALLLFYELKDELLNSRRVLEKLRLVAPDLVIAAEAEVELEGVLR